MQSWNSPAGCTTRLDLAVTLDVPFADDWVSGHGVQCGLVAQEQRVQEEKKNEKSKRSEQTNQWKQLRRYPLFDPSAGP